MKYVATSWENSLGMTWEIRLSDYECKAIKMKQLVDIKFVVYSSIVS